VKGSESVRRVHTFSWALISALLGLAIAIVPASAATSRTPAQQGAERGVRPASSLSNNPVIQQFVKSVGIDEIRNQDALEAFRAWIFTQPGFSRSGYVGSIDKLPRKSMVLMWYGARTPFLSAVLREGHRRGINVSIQHRSYSLQQINAAITAIWKQSAEGKWSGFKISAIVGVSPNDSGITVEGTYTGLSANRRAPQVRALASVVSGVSIRVAPGTSVTPLSGRDADIAPFNSGGFMSADNGSDLFCSSGFAVALNGVTHTETARHCPREGGDDWVDANDDLDSYSSVPASQRYGTTTECSSDGAAAILSGGGYPLMFSGAWDSANTLSVVDFGDVGVGDLVCTEGANSGSHCAIKVTALGVSVNDGYGTVSMIEATQESSSNIAVETGDSGGPVITLANVSAGQVRAAGMIQAGSGDHACIESYLPGDCYSTVFFTSERTIVASTSGLTLDTVNGLISG
jgi:hypothetical protein